MTVAVFFLFSFIGFPSSAEADAGLPMIFVTFPGMLAALIPVVLIEAYVYRRILRASYRRALVASAAANGISTIIGVPLSWLLLVLAQIGAIELLQLTRAVAPPQWQTLLDATLAVIFSGGWVPPNSGAFFWVVPLGSAIGLIVAYPVSLWIEWHIAKRFFEPTRVDAVRRAIRLANRITYGLLFVLVMCWLARNVTWVPKHRASAEMPELFKETLRRRAPRIVERRIGTEHEYVHEMSEGLSLIIQTGKSRYSYRYVDEQGQTVFTFQGVKSGDFHNGLARARDHVNGSLKYGYIDRTGAYAIPPQFDECQDFSEGLAAIGIVGERGRTHGLSDWGYIDKTGRRVIAPQFQDARPFSEGLAAVLVHRWGYIDTAGRMVIKPLFDSASEFSGGVASVERVDILSYTSQWSFLDHTGGPVPRPSNRESSPQATHAQTHRHP